MYTFLDFFRSKRIIVFLWFLHSTQIFSFFEKHNFFQKMYKLQEKHLELDQKLKESLLDLYEIQDYKTTLDEQYKSCQIFLNTYFEYNKVDLEIDTLIVKIASDPLKYSKILGVDQERSINRTILGFCEPFMFTQMDLVLLNHFVNVFHQEERLQSVVLSIQNLRFFTL